MRYVAEMDPDHFFKWCVFDKKLGGAVEGNFDTEDKAWFRALQLERGPKPRYEVIITPGYGMDESNYWGVYDYWKYDGYGMRDATYVLPRLVEQYSSRAKADKECARLNEAAPKPKAVKVPAAKFKEIDAAFFSGVGADVTMAVAVDQIARYLRAYSGYGAFSKRTARERVKKAVPHLYERIMEKSYDGD